MKDEKSSKEIEAQMKKIQRLQVSAANWKYSLLSLLHYPLFIFSQVLLDPWLGKDDLLGFQSPDGPFTSLIEDLQPGKRFL